MPIQLGQKVKDKITGLTGIATGRAEYLYGCNQYCVVPESTDNKPAEGCWFDEGRLEVCGHGIEPKDVQGKARGGPQWDAPRPR